MYSMHSLFLLLVVSRIGHLRSCKLLTIKIVRSHNCEYNTNAYAF